jgi:hypothetical protein
MLQEPHCFVAKMLSEVFICEADPLRVDLLKASFSISNGILDEGILSRRGSSPFIWSFWSQVGTVPPCCRIYLEFIRTLP